jgi:hypothetical protein
MNISMFWDDNINIEGLIFSSVHDRQVVLILSGAIHMECFQ